jgi:flagellar biogenesis protein FliO
MLDLAVFQADKVMFLLSKIQMLFSMFTVLGFALLFVWAWKHLSADKLRNFAVELLLSGVAGILLIGLLVGKVG